MRMPKMVLENTALRWVANRITEPSTYAGAAIIISQLHLSEALVAGLQPVIVATLGFIAVVLREIGAGHSLRASQPTADELNAQEAKRHGA